MIKLNNVNQLEYKYFEDALWLKIFEHNLNISTNFENETEALHSLAPGKFSILKDIELLGNSAKYQGFFLNFCFIILI